MKKTWLALLALGASSLPLAHGCSDADVQCLGTAVECGNRDAEQCTSGCRMQDGCYGGAVACDTLTERPEVCLQTEGCSFVGTCEGVEGCAALEFREACPSTPGCVQVRHCLGDGFECEALEDSQCELYSQCELGGRCVGNAVACGNLATTSQCLAVPGCFPADTSPAILD